MRRHLRRRYRGLRKNVSDQLLHGAAILPRARLRQLGTHHTAPDQIDLVLALVTGDGIDEGKILHRESQSPELRAQSLEPLELVAIYGRPLEMQLCAQAFHLRAQHVDRAII